MKTKTLLVLLTLSFPSLASAQDAAVERHKRKPFSIGFQVTPAVNWMQANTTGVSLDAARVKFGYGLMFEKAFGNNYAFVFGLEHQMGGAGLAFENAFFLSQSDKDGSGKPMVVQTLERNYRYDYVSVPLSLKLMTNQIGYMTYFGQFGADLQFLVSSKAKDNGLLYREGEDPSQHEIDYRDTYAHSSFFNVRLRVGAGAEWNFAGSTSLVFSVTYHHGFIDVLKDASLERLLKEEGIFRSNKDDVLGETVRLPYGMAANLHCVALNVGVIF